MPHSAPPLAQPDLFARPSQAAAITIAPEVVILKRHAVTPPLVAAIGRVSRAAPFRRLYTRGGGQMSVAMTNCGAVGWHSDTHGYRYVDRDPESGRPWPTMPPAFLSLATRAAALAGFPGFEPDCCLVNRYAIGTQMGAHRDFDELDMRHPIVSVSIGLPAVFLWYGATRKGPALPVCVEDGDVVVWGGTARAGYHGVRRVAAPAGVVPGAVRYNLTFRRAR
jgi:alkylated DNA repair protein (DNA oxidative demethylase)